ncbi:MAG: hypothetical protein LBQ12_08690 [Deltaproteobacteria bacterium]|jgi:hypothetical protein|nr:hypothetical protein [Deltaproteobacteria bacterium]
MRTNGPSLETAEVLRLRFSLAEIGGVFKRLKPEPGSRPFFRSSGEAYGLPHLHLLPLLPERQLHLDEVRGGGQNDSWATARNGMEARKLAMLAAEADGMVANAPIETARAAIAAVQAYCEAAGISRGP